MEVPGCSMGGRQMSERSLPHFESVQSGMMDSVVIIMVYMSGNWMRKSLQSRIGFHNSNSGYTSAMFGICYDCCDY